jgi:hypothetical protein
LQHPNSKTFPPLLSCRTCPARRPDRLQKCSFPLRLKNPLQNYPGDFHCGHITVLAITSWNPAGQQSPAGYSVIPRMIPPTSASGMLTNPPRTAAANAFPSKPTLNPPSRPAPAAATAETPAAVTQDEREKLLFNKGLLCQFVRGAKPRVVGATPADRGSG